MSVLFVSIILILVLFTLLSIGLWVAFSLIGIGIIAILFFSDAPVGQILATSMWGNSNSWALAALPLFIWMGEILFRSNITDDIFTGLTHWVKYLPGKLLHVNILGSGIFASVCGSSAATAATIGKVSLSELQKRGYPENLTIGTLAASATLGLLIPPSIVLIVYGVATEQSISRLFLAGILPGLLLLVFFIAFVMIWALINKNKIPMEKDDKKISFLDKLNASRKLIPVFFLILAVIGSIYLGIASPTDAAAVGMVFALFLSWRSKSLNWKNFVEGLMSATKTSCMIAFILTGAAFLTVAMGFTGIQISLAEWIGDLNLSKYQLLIAVTVFFVILGFFLDGLSIVVLTTSVIMPMISKAGIDPIWFGIFLVVVVEIAQITPPVGFNLFVLQSLTGKNIFSIAKSTIPFFIIMLFFLVVITKYPQIVTYLPNQ